MRCQVQHIFFNKIKHSVEGFILRTILCSSTIFYDDDGGDDDNDDKMTNNDKIASYFVF